MTSTSKLRLAEIGDLLRSAMARRNDINWAVETPDTIAAQLYLDEMVTQYVEGTATKLDVKAAYKAYAKTHEIRELFTL